MKDIKVEKKGRGSNRPVSNWLAVAASFLLTALAIYLLSMFVDFSRVRAGLLSADPVYVAEAIAIGIVVALMGLSHKWWIILRRVAPDIKYPEILFLFVSSSPLGILMPFKTSNLVPALYLRKRYGIPVSLVLGTIMFDKITTLMGLVAASTIGALLSNRIPLWIVFSAWAGAVLLLLPGVMRSLFRITGILKTRWRDLAELFLDRFDNASWREKLFLVSYGFILQICLSFALLLVMKSVGVDIPLIEGVFLGTAVILVANLPLTIGGIGTREGMVILVFGDMAARESLVAGSLLFLSLELISQVIIGILFMPIMFKRLMSKDYERKL
ncbi:MAG: flippase-like domain-containing protein [Deltaproteobacteria bacterium]|nr:flippase-like domain-containing protein [Deltaproteobacteria bacterium]